MALRDLKGLDDDLRDEFLAAINSLREDQAPKGAKKLRGYKLPTFRLRIGQFRLVYRVEKTRLVVLVLTIADRKSVYERLKRVV